MPGAGMPGCRKTGGREGGGAGRQASSQPARPPAYGSAVVEALAGCMLRDQILFLPPSAFTLSSYLALFACLPIHMFASLPVSLSPSLPYSLTPSLSRSRYSSYVDHDCTHRHVHQYSKRRGWCCDSIVVGALPCFSMFLFVDGHPCAEGPNGVSLHRLSVMIAVVEAQAARHGAPQGYSDRGAD